MIDFIVNNSDIDWVEIIKTLGTTIIAIIAAVSSLIAVLKGKENKDLKKKNNDKETEIKRLHNGFRESVDKRLAVLENRVTKTCEKCRGKN